MKIDEHYDDLTCPSCKATKPRKLVTAFRTNTCANFLDTMERKVSPEKFK